MSYFHLLVSAIVLLVTLRSCWIKLKRKIKITVNKMVCCIPELHPALTCKNNEYIYNINVSTYKY